MEEYPASYALPIIEHLITAEGGHIYKHQKTGKWHTGWFHCGCCGRNGLASINTPTCTGCANKLNLDIVEDSPKSTEYIQAYCDYWNNKR